MKRALLFAALAWACSSSPADNGGDDTSGGTSSGGTSSGGTSSGGTSSGGTSSGGTSSGGTSSGGTSSGGTSSGGTSSGGTSSGGTSSGGTSSGGTSSGGTGSCQVDADCATASLPPCASTVCGTSCATCDQSSGICGTNQLPACAAITSIPKATLASPVLEGLCCSTGGTTSLPSLFDLASDNTHLFALGSASSGGGFFAGTTSAGQLAKIVIPKMNFAVWAFFSDDAKHIAIFGDIGAADGAPAFFITAADGSGAAQVDKEILIPQAALHVGPTVVYESKANNANQDTQLKLISWTSTTPTLLEVNPNDFAQNASGTRVSWEVGSPLNTLKTVEASAPTAVHTLSTSVLDYTWSPDGAHIFWIEVSGALKLASWDGSGVQTLSAGTVSSVQFSADGALLTYVTQDANNIETVHVHPISAGSTSADWSYVPQHCTRITGSPFNGSTDGGTLIDSATNCEVDGGFAELQDAGTLEHCEPVPSFIFPAFSGDGQRLAFSVDDGVSVQLQAIPTNAATNDKPVSVGEPKDDPLAGGVEAFMPVDWIPPSGSGADAALMLFSAVTDPITGEIGGSTYGELRVAPIKGDLAGTCASSGFESTASTTIKVVQNVSAAVAATSLDGVNAQGTNVRLYGFSQAGDALYYLVPTDPAGYATLRALALSMTSTEKSTTTTKSPFLTTNTTTNTATTSTDTAMPGVINVGGDAPLPQWANGHYLVYETNMPNDGTGNGDLVVEKLGAATGGKVASGVTSWRVRADGSVVYAIDDASGESLYLLTLP